MVQREGAGETEREREIQKDEERNTERDRDRERERERDRQTDRQRTIERTRERERERDLSLALIKTRPGFPYSEALIMACHGGAAGDRCSNKDCFSLSVCRQSYAVYMHQLSALSTIILLDVAFVQFVYFSKSVECS